MTIKTTAQLAISLTLLCSSAMAVENSSEESKLRNAQSTYLKVSSNYSFWVGEKKLSANTFALIHAIENSRIHGFNPESYGLSAINADVKKLQANAHDQESILDKKHVRLRQSVEAKLDKAFNAFVKDLGQGMVNAEQVQENLYRSAPSVNVRALRNKIADGTFTVNEAIRSVTPSAPIYVAMNERMDALLFERESNTPRTPVEMFDIEHGHSDPAVLTLKKRLLETGDLKNVVQLDSTFDSNIEEALTAVQTRHGLLETGKLTKATVNALNATVDEDIVKLAMNLERWRWMPRELGYRHIMANIPEYKVTLMNGDQRIIHMPVVVGSKRHKTAIFSDSVEFLEMAPTWTVPTSITNNELIPLELRKPGYLKREKLDFFTWVNGKLVPVPASRVSAADFQKKPFPYVLRQRAGKDNALGELKILFPNRFAIYMHDTQAKKLFAKADRAYSHGCIRLGDPFRMASLLLQLDGKNPAETEEILALKKTTRIRFNEETPVHLTYVTSWIDAEGAFHKRKDVYGYNAKLKRALLAENSLIANLKKRPVITVSEQLLDQ